MVSNIFKIFVVFRLMSKIVVCNINKIQLKYLLNKLRNIIYSFKIFLIKSKCCCWNLYWWVSLDLNIYFDLSNFTYINIAYFHSFLCILKRGSIDQFIWSIIIEMSQWSTINNFMMEGYIKLNWHEYILWTILTNFKHHYHKPQHS